MMKEYKGFLGFVSVILFLIAGLFIYFSIISYEKHLPNDENINCLSGLIQSKAWTKMEVKSNFTYDSDGVEAVDALKIKLPKDSIFLVDKKIINKFLSALDASENEIYICFVGVRERIYELPYSLLVNDIEIINAAERKKEIYTNNIKRIILISALIIIGAILFFGYRKL